MSDTAKVYVAFLWHQHQPYYTDDIGGETSMPWVRLHGVKDYIGMANIVERCPEMKLTINLVPSLLKQILDQTEGGHEDNHMRLSRKPADEVGDEEKEYILRHFFQANRQHMIDTLPRYRGLLLKRDSAFKGHKPLKHFRPQDILDLQLLANLTWIHPTEMKKDPALLDMAKKGRDFTEEEKKYVLDKHIQLLAEVIPAHKRLMEEGRVELTTTPFYHPILPLLTDMESAKQCMPGVRLPLTMTDNRQYAGIHVKRAVEYHEKLFGRKPRGMWPAEGSVSAEIIPMLADAGIEWIATDEEILARSIKEYVRRDGHGHVRNPEMLYKPYVAEASDKRMHIFFRDHYLSDLIGFHYSAAEANAAVADFESRLRNVVSSHKGNPLIVSVILDGENAWEYYPNQAIDFLSMLYGRVCEMDGVMPVTFAEYLDRKPPTGEIKSLFPGSWINHDFYIWIGHQEDVEGWEQLNQTKDYLDSKKSDVKYDKETIEKAEEELLIAQGSDWYWWFGADHSSANDREFDLLFRTHLKNVYRLLDEEPPGRLDLPIKQSVSREIFTQPRTMLSVKMDGRVSSFFEWLGAGHYACESEHGAMDKSSSNILTNIYFGFDESRLFIRIDAASPLSDLLAEGHHIRLNFIYPEEGWMEVADGGEGPCDITVSEGFASAGVAAEAVIDAVLEIAVPFEMFKLKDDKAVNFFVELVKDGKVSEKAPSGAPVNVCVPTEEFDATIW